MSDNTGKTVAEILLGKKASVPNAALPTGSPTWDEILHLNWDEIVDRAKRRLPGYKTMKKLLSSSEYDKMNGDTLRTLLAFLKRLDDAKLSYTLANVREDAVMVRVAVPGQRWEIELVDYGDEFHWEIERFVSAGKMDDEAALTDLFAQFSDEESAAAHQTASV